MFLFLQRLSFDRPDRPYDSHCRSTLGGQSVARFAIVRILDNVLSDSPDTFVLVIKISATVFHGPIIILTDDEVMFREVIYFILRLLRILRADTSNFHYLLL